MNDFIKKLTTRTSVRYYTEKPIERTKINHLKAVINNSPTSMNCQAFSAIFIKDQNVKKLYAQLNWNQKHLQSCPLLIVFLADYNRIKYSLKKHQISQKIDDYESYTIATVDAAIAASNCANAAISMGLGVCFIGGIRLFADDIKKTLHLKGKCTPIVGLTVGYEAKKVPFRPKVNKVYDESYNLENVCRELEKYDEIMHDYYKKNFNLDTTFTKITAKSLSKLDHSKRKTWVQEQFEVND